ncbi:hypothetical protein B0H14DRAFT_2557274 [Mycena olivaceomarginata]|nr:hypothetical protein B0H14DRAFT_2557274 [Mycena olivaceomarginata]
MPISQLPGNRNIQRSLYEDREANDRWDLRDNARSNDKPPTLLSIVLLASDSHWTWWRTSLTSAYRFPDIMGTLLPRALVFRDSLRRDKGTRAEQGTNKADNEQGMNNPAQAQHRDILIRKRRVVLRWTEKCPGRAGDGAESCSKRSNVEKFTGTSPEWLFRPVLTLFSLVHPLMGKLASPFIGIWHRNADAYKLHGCIAFPEMPELRFNSSHWWYVGGKVKSLPTMKYCAGTFGWKVELARDSKATCGTLTGRTSTPHESRDPASVAAT